MKIPAIRGKIGTTVFYTSKMTFAAIATHVSPINDELHKSKSLNDMIQRGITDNAKDIVKYIKQQPDRFFNSLVLAVYSGCPQWIEVEMDFPSEGDKIYRDMGFLEFSGDEKIFPVDGQHRVEAIRKAIQEDASLSNESVGVIFIAHSVVPDGIEKTRRIFSTLNRYAKPVSPRDIIALDEDDIVAISTRMLLTKHPFFEGESIATPLSKGIPTGNTKCFTSIIALSDCNRALLECFLKHPKPQVIRNFIRIRPSEIKITEFYTFMTHIWNILLEYPDMQEYQKTGIALRNESTGGSLLFRPVGLIPFFEACKRINKSKNVALQDILSKFRTFDFSVSNRLWQDILWNNDSKTMLMNNQTLTRRIFMYVYDETSLPCKEKDSLKANMNACKKIDNAWEILNSYRL